MANIADGWMSIAPVSKAFFDELCVRIKVCPMIFSYGGPVDCSLRDQKMEIGFTGRWQCRDAWGFMDDLLTGDDFPFKEELLNSRIDGRGEEPYCGYLEGIRKLPGETVLKRRFK